MATTLDPTLLSTLQTMKGTQIIICGTSQEGRTNVETARVVPLTDLGNRKGNAFLTLGPGQLFKHYPGRAGLKAEGAKEEALQLGGGVMIVREVGKPKDLFVAGRTAIVPFDPDIFSTISAHLSRER